VATLARGSGVRNEGTFTDRNQVFDDGRIADEEVRGRFDGKPAKVKEGILE
jgi:hypothetical protein